MTILTANRDSVRAASGTWQQQMKWAIRDLESLCQQLKLPVSVVTKGIAAGQEFPVFVPLPFLNRIEIGNINDPLLQQVLPTAGEGQSPKHFSKDPLDESSAVVRAGLLQKYHGRVLLITTGVCAVHCRYCFRRHYPYSQAPKSVDQWIPALEQIEADPSIEEVILSGGDPLAITDNVLQALMTKIESIDHVKRIRFHSRLPIMIPQRVTEELVAMIQSTRLQTFFVIHSNHANEFDSEVDQSIGRLRSAGSMLLNQSVLLRGINDDLETLVALSQRLLQVGVLPYYLHQLDPVVGTAHFEVDRVLGESLIAEMRGRLPGYAVPRYVKELAGEASKTVWS